MSQAEFAAALRGPAAPCPAGLRAWNGSDPALRFAVHRNNVVSGLIDALAEGFPVTQALVGSEFFRAMAAHFVRQHLPRSPVLAHYGEDLPDFIAGFEPARPLPYLADVARLERARVRAFHAADVPPLAAEAVGAALARIDRVDALCALAHPSVSLLVSPYAVVSLWAAHQVDDPEALAAVDPGVAESALVLRDGLDVLVLRLAPGFARFFGALLGGVPLAEANAAAAADAGGQGAAFDLTAALTLAARHGAFTALRDRDEELR
ncbi:MAG: putative DNA-binding domain-containing protein [Burkholderiaceae bacterium]|nr:putative DNA-binding domain-containing protein [Burkholderiaceae bacterium]